MRTTIFFVLAICTLHLNAQTPDQVLYHIDNTIENVATSVATVPGEIAVTGYALLSPSEEGVKTAIPYICKKDHHGNVIWMRTYHVEGEEDPGISLYPNNIIKTSDEGYLIGGNIKLDSPVDNNIFLIKVDSDGNLDWFSLYNCESLPIEGTFYCDGIYLHHISEMLEGGYLLSGSNSFSYETATLALAIKMDANGVPFLMRDYYLPGHQENDLLKSFNLSNGDFISLVRSTQTIENGGKIDKAILRRLDQQFNIIWEKSIIDENTDKSFYARDLVVDLDGNFIVLGESSNNQNFLAKLNGSGAVQWVTSFDKPSTFNIFRPRAITKDIYGNLYFTGFIENNQVESPSYVIKTDANGNKQWANLYGNNRPFGDANDIELIKFPEFEFTYGDNFVFVGRYSDFTVTTVTPSWVVNGLTANGETECRYDDFSVNSNEESYRTNNVSFEESDLTYLGLDIVMESPEKEYTRIACNPFYFPMAENNNLDQLHYVPELVETGSERKVVIGPNPSNGSFTIFTHSPATIQNSSIGDIKIFDSMGRLVDQSTIENQQHLRFENFPKGHYLIKIAYGNEVSNHSIIIQ